MLNVFRVIRESTVFIKQNYKALNKQQSEKIKKGVRD